jgi:hypothetical protein
MNTRTILLALVTFFVLGMGTTQAQYRTAAGVRLGYPNALSIKHFISDANAIEAYVGARFFVYSSTIWVSGAYQFHNPIEIDGIDGLQWYVGVGATAAFWSYNNLYINRNDNFASTTIGLQGYLGLDWAPFGDIPLAFSVDWVPTFFLGRANRYYGNFSRYGVGYGNLAIRYILGQ